MSRPDTGPLPGTRDRGCRSHLGAMLAVLLLAGCGGAEFNPVSGTERFPPYQGDVEVLRAFPAHGDFVRLGVVSAQGAITATEDSLIKILRKEAAEHGADTIVLQSGLRKIRGLEGTVHKMAAFAIRRRR